MARFMEIKSTNPKLKQSETAKELGCSSSTLKRYRNYINMFSPYRFHRRLTRENKRILKENNTEHEPKRPQMS